MRRASKSAVTLVGAMAFAAFLLPVASSRAQAQSQPQSDCKIFTGMVQGTLPSPYQFDKTDTWGGPLHATLDGELLMGGLSGNDGKKEGTGAVTLHRNGLYKVCFGASFFGMKWGGPSDCYHSFSYKVPVAIASWPNVNLLGMYRAVVAEIVPGTGKFQAASGHLHIVGPFITWSDAGSPIKVSGRWSGELNGTICGVQ
jgi:hypothetical protein